MSKIRHSGNRYRSFRFDYYARPIISTKSMCPLSTQAGRRNNDGVPNVDSLSTVSAIQSINFEEAQKKARKTLAFSLNF